MKTIQLTRGYVALIDDHDFDRVAQFEWRAHVRPTTVYATCSERKPGKRATILMHDFILGIKGVDHKDANGLNNQRDNLRSANKSQNGANRRKQAGTSRYKGVSWDKQSGKWRAQILKAGIKKSIGYFQDEEDAATAYNFSAEEAFGEFARLNTPEGVPI